MQIVTALHQDLPPLAWHRPSSCSRSMYHHNAAYSSCSDPEEWSITNVKYWIEWAVKRFGLVDVDVSNFDLTGKQLCELQHEDFVKYIPIDQGDVFWTHLELLRKCKFVGG